MLSESNRTPEEAACWSQFVEAALINHTHMVAVLVLGEDQQEQQRSLFRRWLGWCWPASQGLIPQRRMIRTIVGKPVAPPLLPESDRNEAYLRHNEQGKELVQEYLQLYSEELKRLRMRHCIPVSEITWCVF